jgi:hypothetical protein
MRTKGGNWKRLEVDRIEMLEDGDGGKMMERTMKAEEEE